MAMTDPKAPVICIDSLHSRAICDEIGYRLRILLQREALELPPSLRALLDRFAELDSVASPSIVPSHGTFALHSEMQEI